MAMDGSSDAKRSYCWLECAIGGAPLSEKVIVELYDDITPKTCENFRTLCNDAGDDVRCVEGTSTKMTFKNSTFHRIIPSFMIQGGDFTNHNGTGGVSIYGEKFADENFEMKCDRAGLLAMANAGPNTNGSQFFITTAPAPHLNGKHVVFGRVVRGMNTVRALEHTETGANDKPVRDCVVVACGVLANGKDDLPSVPSNPATAEVDAYPDYPEDNDPALNDEQLIEAGEKLRQLGNGSFKTASYAQATATYSKAVRYLETATKTSANEKRINESLVACFNNSSMCSIKESKWVEARALATKVVQLDPKNSKALFRRGLAYMHANDNESAITDFQLAQKIEPDNAEIAAKLKEAKEKEKENKEKMAARFKKMFA